MVSGVRSLLSTLEGLGHLLDHGAKAHDGTLTTLQVRVLLTSITTQSVGLSRGETRSGVLAGGEVTVDLLAVVIEATIELVREERGTDGSGHAAEVELVVLAVDDQDMRHVADPVGEVETLPVGIVLELLGTPAELAGRPTDGRSHDDHDHLVVVELGQLHVGTEFGFVLEQLRHTLPLTTVGGEGLEVQQVQEKTTAVLVGEVVDDRDEMRTTRQGIR